MVKLLSGGNPQIPKGDGDAVVQSYIEAMPDWKQAIGRRLDELVTAAVPDVRKAVRWNSPWYGTTRGWFVTFHCITRYVKVTFVAGTELAPMPPVPSKSPGARFYHIYEGEWDEQQFTDWVRQAAALCGWDGF